MISPWLILAMLVGAYLFGAVPFGLIVSSAQGIDIRKHGSGNVGATNVGRVLGRKWGALVFALDACKGAAVTVAAGLILPDHGGAGPILRDLLWLGAGLACVIGNIAPVYLRFRGGKGVATSLGAMLGIYPYLTFPALIILVVWAAVVKASGYVSLGSIAAALCLPPTYLLLSWTLGWRVSKHFPLLGLCIALTAVVLLRHRDNIRRLMSGTENKVGPSAPGTQPPPR